MLGWNLGQSIRQLPRLLCRYRRHFCLHEILAVDGHIRGTVGSAPKVCVQCRRLAAAFRLQSMLPDHVNKQLVPTHKEGTKSVTLRLCLGMVCGTESQWVNKLTPHHRASVVSSGWKAVASKTPDLTATITLSRPCRWGEGKPSYQNLILYWYQQKSGEDQSTLG